MRLPAAGGVASALTALDPSRRETTDGFPSFLPDGRHFVYLRLSNTSAGSGVYRLDFSMPKPKEEQLEDVAPDDVWARSLRTGFGFGVN